MADNEQTSFVFEIQKLLTDPYASVLIVTPKDRIKGILVDDISLPGQVEWSTIGMSGAQQAAGEAVAKLGQLTGLWAQTKLETYKQTEAVYNGTTKPQLVVPLMFVAIQPKDDVRDMIMALFKGVYPEGDVMVKAPFEWKGDLQNTCSLKIGAWFKATGLLLRSVDSTISKIPIKGGKPLYARVNVTFDFFKLPNVKDMLGWFPGASGTPGGSYLVKAE